MKNFVIGMIAGIMLLSLVAATTSIKQYFIEGVPSISCSATPKVCGSINSNGSINGYAIYNKKMYRLSGDEVILIKEFK